MVRIAAVVRDQKGRFVQDLTRATSRCSTAGRRGRSPTSARDLAGVSVAVLFDVSGSMEGQLPNAREAAATSSAGWTRRATKRRLHLRHASRRADAVHDRAADAARVDGRVVPFGATSLHDAIAATARKVGEREGRRRAVVVLTDGADNWSRLTPAEVSGLASAIDVPVYIFGIAPSIDNPTEEASTKSVSGSAFSGPLADLASWTGGHVFVASTPGQRSIAARQIIDELRHQYLIAFESSGKPGWHPLVVRARNKDLTVRARSGYIAGQSSPTAD
jgi:VWFA-related protein